MTVFISCISTHMNCSMYTDTKDDFTFVILDLSLVYVKRQEWVLWQQVMVFILIV